MRNIIAILIFILFPFLIQAAAGIVNNQPLYAVPPNSSNVLIFDATLSEAPNFITIYNNGTAGQADIAKIFVFEDGNSPGWDGDEREVLFKSSSPFWESKLSGSFSQKRIFVTVDIASNAGSGRTLHPKIKTDFSEEEILGLERKILAGASAPQIPSAPLVQKGEAISASTIRWYFLDLANNEFGFKILDGQLKKVSVSESADLSYLDEAGLEPSTCYSGRRAVAFNDRGESNYSANFSEVCTLIEEVRPPEEVAPQTVSVSSSTPSVKEAEPPVIQEDSNITIRLKIIDILKQLIQLLQDKIAVAQASIFQAFEAIISWLQ